MALELWLKITKPGGILCIVHKAAIWPKWQDQQDKLVASKAWEKVWISEEPVSFRTLTFFRTSNTHIDFIESIIKQSLIFKYQHSILQIPYLPSLSVPGTDRAKIYIYRKL